jgi:hypothetical protein
VYLIYALFIVNKKMKLKLEFYNGLFNIGNPYFYLLLNQNELRGSKSCPFFFIPEFGFQKNESRNFL